MCIGWDFGTALDLMRTGVFFIREKSCEPTKSIDQRLATLNMQNCMNVDRRSLH